MLLLPCAQSGLPSGFRVRLLLLVTFQTCVAYVAFATTAPTGDTLNDRVSQVEQLREAGEYEKAVARASDLLTFAREQGSPEQLAEAYLQVVLSHYFADQKDKARSFLEIGLTHSRLHDLARSEADLLNARGVIQWKTGNLWQARRELEKAMAIKKELGDPVAVANIANNLGNIEYALRRYDEAVQRYQSALASLGPDHPNQRLRASLLSNIGESLLRMDQLEDAENYLNRSLALEQLLNDPHYLAYTYFNLGELRSRQKKHKDARKLLEQALALQESSSNRWGASLTRLHLARSWFTQGDSDAALRILKTGYQDSKSLKALDLLRDYSSLYAEIYREKGQSGLAEYYEELHQWFEQRLKAPDSSTSDKSAPASEASAETRQPEQTSDLSLSPWRLSVLILLGLLIAVLLIENRRLRKQQGTDRSAA